MQPLWTGVGLPLVIASVHAGAVGDGVPGPLGAPGPGAGGGPHGGEHLPGADILPHLDPLVTSGELERRLLETLLSQVFVASCSNFILIGINMRSLILNEVSLSGDCLFNWYI